MSRQTDRERERRTRTPGRTPSTRSVPLHPLLCLIVLTFGSAGGLEEPCPGRSTAMTLSWRPRAPLICARNCIELLNASCSRTTLLGAEGPSTKCKQQSCCKGRVGRRGSRKAIETTYFKPNKLNKGLPGFSYLRASSRGDVATHACASKTHISHCNVLVHLKSTTKQSNQTNSSNGGSGE